MYCISISSDRHGSECFPVPPIISSDTAAGHQAQEEEVYLPQCIDNARKRALLCHNSMFPLLKFLCDQCCEEIPEGIVRRGSGEPSLLKQCYTSVLSLAYQHNLRSLAFPAISTGIYGYPKKEATILAVETVFDYLINHNNQILEQVIFCCFDEETLSLYQNKILSL